MLREFNIPEIRAEYNPGSALPGYPVQPAICLSEGLHY